ncbi:MAG: IS3 family transposase, partial [Patescibacteria group bacterium]
IHSALKTSPMQFALQIAGGVQFKEQGWCAMKGVQYELDYQSCQSFEELRLVIEKYMRYYNYERKQWTRNKMTPVEYRQHLSAESRGVGVGFESVH